MKKNLGWLSLCVFFVLFFAGCAGKGGTLNLQKVRLNEVTRSIFYCPQYVAQGLGFFKDEGLFVEISASGGSDKTMTAVVSGQADIGLLGSAANVYVKAEGCEEHPKIFAQLTCRDGDFIVGREEERNFSFENLQGKSIIAGRRGGHPDMVLKYLLEKHGLVLGQDVQVLNNIQFEAMGAAFARGAGDYVLMLEPAASLMARDQNVHLLKFLGEDCGDIAYTCYSARQSFIKENPEIVQGFVNAISRAQRWVQTHTPSEIAQVVAPFFADTDPKILEKAIENYQKWHVWAESPEVTKGSFDLLQEIMQSAGELKAPENFEDLVDNTFARQAKLN